MDPATFTFLVYTLQITTITSLIFISGLSSCLSSWVMPLTSMLPPKLAARQFQQTFTWGSQYLQPSSRILGALLVLTTVLTAYLPDPVEAEKWKTWATLFFILITVAPYEIYAIFWINDRVDEIVEELQQGKIEEEERKKEINELLGKWAFRNYGRVGLPLVVGGLAMTSIVTR